MSPPIESSSTIACFATVTYGVPLPVSLLHLLQSYNVRRPTHCNTELWVLAVCSIIPIPKVFDRYKPRVFHYNPAKPLVLRWCGRRGSNPHDFRHGNLNPARLPIPPRPRQQGGPAARLISREIRRTLEK